jgi:hypothetical protein
MDEKEESCCTIDYEHHKEIFEQRRQAFLKDPDQAVTTHQAKIRLIRDHYKEAKVPGGYVIGCDEPAERGGMGKGPAPLQYLVSSVGL